MVMRTGLRAATTVLNWLVASFLESAFSFASFWLSSGGGTTGETTGGARPGTSARHY